MQSLEDRWKQLGQYYYANFNYAIKLVKLEFSEKKVANPRQDICRMNLSFETK